MPWVVRLYLLGVFLSLLTAFFGLMDFLGDLMPLPSLDPCLSSQWRKPESGPQVDSPHQGSLVGKGRADQAFGSFS